VVIRQVGIFAEAEQFKDSFVANLVYQSCINELLLQSDQISRHLEEASGLEILTEILTADLQKCEDELEAKWERASLLYEGVC